MTLKAVKDTAVEALQERFPEHRVIRGTVFQGKPYVWVMDDKGAMILKSWPAGVTLDG